MKEEEERAKKIVSFRGAQIPQIEVDVLQDLEKQLGRQFNLVNKVKCGNSFLDVNPKMAFSVENNRITGLHCLSRYLSNMLSTLPESIGNLESLETLDLSSNQLSTLPESIGNLKSLETLRLNHNKLSTLPESIGQLSSLQILWLNGNKFTTLPESISNLKSLETLDLSHNQLSTLPESILNLKSLTYLNVGYNNISTLPESISNLKSLTHLRVINNQLFTLPESIGDLKSLTYLNVGYNNISTLPESIGNLESLETLDISYNQLSTLPGSIGQLSSLKGLWLDGNNLTTLSESIGALKSITSLYVRSNNISTLPESIGNLTSLQELHLSNNKLMTLPDSIGNLTSLQELHLSNNKLMTLPESIGNLKSLTNLYLNNNKLSTLPESIGNLSSLKELNLNGNQLLALPGSIGNLKSLTYLDLTSNKLSTLPESIGNLKSLEKLYLYYNNDLLTLPESITHLHQLRELNVERTNLNLTESTLEYIWKYIYGLKAEQALVLVELERKIGKTIPEVRDSIMATKNFGDSIYLGVKIVENKINALWLKDCFLKSLPNSFGKLEDLQFLDLEGNELANLPESFKNLKNLKELILNHNKFETLSESSISHLTSLQTLDLRNNQLTTIPESMLSPRLFQITKLDGNPLDYQELANTSKAKALRSSSHDKQVMMDLAEQLEKRFEKKPRQNKDKKLFIYAVIVVCSGLFVYIAFGASFQGANNNVLWVLFLIALTVNFLVGTSIIATLSGYIKNFIIESSFKNRIIGAFDIFVAFYLIWSIRSVVKTLFNVELLITIDIVFEYALPPWALDILMIFGYDAGLTFLENLNIILGHFILKLFSFAIVFWALYKNGIGYLKSTAFDKEKQENVKPFLVLGLVGSIILALMSYSTLDPLLDVGYSAGAIIACCVFIREQNKHEQRNFYIFIGIIGSGILVAWLLSFWNGVVSFIFGLSFVALFFYARYTINISGKYVKHDISRKQARALRKIQVKSNILLPRLSHDEVDKVGVIFITENALEINLMNCGLTTLPKALLKLESLLTLNLEKNPLVTNPDSRTKAIIIRLKKNGVKVTNNSIREGVSY